MICTQDPGHSQRRILFTIMMTLRKVLFVSCKPCLLSPQVPCKHMPTDGEPLSRPCLDEYSASLGRRHRSG